MVAYTKILNNSAAEAALGEVQQEMTELLQCFGF